MPLEAGSKLGPYEIISPLGAGGMGEVYRALDSRLGREVALKVLHDEVTAQPGRLARFDREARAIAALNHPHIITLYSSEEDKGIRFLTMELVDGCTLAEVITTHGMALPHFLEIAVQLSDALAAAHQKQITHRDLKPGNVMVTEDGRVKVLDFGLARVGHEEAAPTATIEPLTREGTIIGTMPYMSPEQIEGKPIDPRSDLFSLGIIFYEMLNGERPFKGLTSPALISAIMRDTPASIGEKRKDIPATLCRLVHRLLEKHPEGRIQTAREVHHELKGFHHAIGETIAEQEIPSDLVTIEMQRQRSSPAASPPTTRDSLGGKISVAVRPFRGGSNADATAIADGLTTDIATRLARFGYFKVLSSSAIDQQPPPAGSRYAIEGEVRASGSTVRVSARLVDLSSGTQIWAQNYDRVSTMGTFEILDDVADRIAATIADSGGELMRAVAAAHSDAANSPAVRFSNYAQNFNAEEHARLRTYFTDLVAQEPDHTSAWGFLSLLYCHEVTFGFNPLPNPIARAREAADRAIALDAGNQRGWFAHAMAAFLDHDAMAFRSGAERAIELNELSSVTLATCGMFLCYAGDTTRGAELVRKAMSLNPHHPGWYHTVLFADAFMSGQADVALTHANLITMPHLPTSGLFIAAAAGRFGRAAEAKLGIDAWMRANDGKPFDPAGARAILMRWMWEGALLDALMDGLAKAHHLAGSDAT